jgi:hypothetical protein
MLLVVMVHVRRVAAERRVAFAADDWYARPVPILWYVAVIVLHSARFSQQKLKELRCLPASILHYFD